MSDGPRKRALIIAGPNGAGKTTFALQFLPREAGLFDFVNADAIAAGLSPLDPSRAAAEAGRLMVRTIRNHVLRGNDFALETTLAGRRYVRLIPKWQEEGYRVGLIFLALPTVQVAIDRVAQRVRSGGHGVAEAVIRRRFRSGRDNFDQIYRQRVDEWWLYDNSGLRPQLVQRGTRS